MAPETPEVTENSTDETLRYLREIHEMLRLLTGVLVEWGPVLEQFKNPVSAYGAARRARRNGRAGVQ